MSHTYDWQQLVFGAADDTCLSDMVGKDLVRLLDVRPGMTPPLQNLEGRFPGGSTAYGTLSTIQDVLNALTDMSAFLTQRGKVLPVFTTSPHEGEFCPRHLLNALRDPKAVRYMADFPDRGAAFLRWLPGLIPSVGFPISRYIIDPNRLPGAPARVAGVVPTTILHDCAWGKPLYRDGYEVPEADLVHSWWTWYWRQAVALAHTVLNQVPFGCPVLAADIHTFAPTAKGFQNWAGCYGPDEAEKWKTYPAFILGTRDGETCDPRILEILKERLTAAFQHWIVFAGGAAPLSVSQAIFSRVEGRKIIGCNDPFKGVANVQILRAIDPLRVHAVQIEVAEAMYFNEDTCTYDMPALMMVRTILSEALTDVGRYLLSDSRSGKF